MRGGRWEWADWFGLAVAVGTTLIIVGLLAIASLNTDP